MLCYGKMAAVDRALIRVVKVTLAETVQSLDTSVEMRQQRSGQHLSSSSSQRPCCSCLFG